MIYVIYFFAVIGFLCSCSAVAITVIMVKQTIVNHKNDIDVKGNV